MPEGGAVAGCPQGRKAVADGKWRAEWQREGEVPTELWFTADTHFGHARILEFHRPEFSSAEEMDEHLIEQINRYVSRTDRLYHLGDFQLGGNYLERAKEYLARIRCQEIHLVFGNHDRFSLGRLFRSARQIKQVSHAGRVLVLCHYPMASWPKSHYGSIHLYGHCHGRLEAELDWKFPGRRSMDVGVDAVKKWAGEYRPVSFEEVVSRLISGG